MLLTYAQQQEYIQQTVDSKTDNSLWAALKLTKKKRADGMAEYQNKSSENMLLW